MKKTRTRNTLALSLIAGAILFGGGAAGADSLAFEVDLDESVLAVVTHKAGFGSGLAHNHFVTAPRPEVELELDPDNEVCPIRLKATLSYYMRNSIARLTFNHNHRINAPFGQTEKYRRGSAVAVTPITGFKIDPQKQEIGAASCINTNDWFCQFNLLEKQWNGFPFSAYAHTDSFQI